MAREIVKIGLILFTLWFMFCLFTGVGFDQTTEDPIDVIVREYHESVDRRKKYQRERKIRLNLLGVEKWKNRI